MAQQQTTLMDPPIEELLDKVDSKFTLVALASRRARQVNSYYNSLGEGLGVVVPPQVASASGKPLSIAFEEVAAAKATYTRPDPEEDTLPVAIPDPGPQQRPQQQGPQEALCTRRGSATRHRVRWMRRSRCCAMAATTRRSSQAARAWCR